MRSSPPVARTLASFVLAAATLLAPVAATADRAQGASPPAPRPAGPPPAVYPPADPSRPLATFPAAVNPGAMAVDPRTGHIFLLIPPPGTAAPDGSYQMPPGPGTLATYDARAGAPMRTIPVPSGTGTLLLDGPRGRLYVIAGTIQVVDARTGALLRTIPIPASAAAIDPASGHLLLATTADAAGLPPAAGMDGAVVALDPIAPARPAVIFRTRLGTNLDALGVDPPHRRVYVADAGSVTQTGGRCASGRCTSAVYALDSATGRLLAATALHDPDEETAYLPERATCLAVAPAADRVVVTETAGNRSDGEVRVLDARTGALLSTAAANVDPCVLAMDQRSGRAYIAHGNYYLSDQSSGGVEILDMRRGVFVNEFRSTGRYPIAILADPNARAMDVLWASSYRPPPGLPEGVLMVLDAGTGAEVREVPLAANPLAAGTDPARGGLIVLNRPARDGYYTARAGEASSLTRLPAGPDAPPGIVPLDHSPAGIVVDPPAHRAFIIAAGPAGAPDSPATGLVDVVDTSSGALLRAVPVGMAPRDIALDAAAGKVYVLNAGSGDRVPPSISILSATDGTPLAVAGFRVPSPIGSPAIYALAGHLYLVGSSADGPSGAPSTWVETRDRDTGALLSRRAVPGSVAAAAADPARDHLWLALDRPPHGPALFDAIGTAAPHPFPYAFPGSFAVDAAGGQLYRSPADPRHLRIVGTSPAGRALRTTTLPVAAVPGGDGPRIAALAADGAIGRLFAITAVPVAYAGVPLPATLWVVDAATGRVLGSRPLGVAPAGLTLDATSGRVFVPDAGGTVQVFDARTGAPLATAATEPGSGPLGVDPASGRVLVVNTAGDSLSILDARTGVPLPLRPGAPPVPVADPAEVEMPTLSSASIHATRSPDGLVHLRRYLLPIGAIGAEGWRPRAPAFRTLVPGTAFATAGLPFAARVAAPASAPFPEVALANEAGAVLAVAPTADPGLVPTSPAFGHLARDGSVRFDLGLETGDRAAPGARIGFFDLQVWPTASGIALQIAAEHTHRGSAAVTLRLALPPGSQLVPGPGGSLLVGRPGRPADFVLGPPVARDTPDGPSWLAHGESRGPATLLPAAGPGGSRVLTLQVDRGWLARHPAASLFLPIGTGPSVAQSGSAATLERCPSSHASTPARLLVGRQGACAERGLLTFRMPRLPAGALLQDVALHLYSPALAGPTGIVAYPALAPPSPAGPLPAPGGVPPPGTGTAGIAEQQGTDATGGHRWDLTTAIGPGLRGPASGTVIVGLQGDGASLGFTTGQEVPQADPTTIPYLEIAYRPRAS